MRSVKGNRREGALRRRKQCGVLTTPILQGQERDRGGAQWGMEPSPWAWTEGLWVGGDAATASPQGWEDER